MQMLTRSIVWTSSPYNRTRIVDVCALDKRALRSLDRFFTKLLKTSNMGIRLLRHVRKFFIVNYQLYS